MDLLTEVSSVAGLDAEDQIMQWRVQAHQGQGSQGRAEFHGEGEGERLYVVKEL